MPTMSHAHKNRAETEEALNDFMSVLQTPLACAATRICCNASTAASLPAAQPAVMHTHTGHVGILYYGFAIRHLSCRMCTELSVSRVPAARGSGGARSRSPGARRISAPRRGDRVRRARARRQRTHAVSMHGRRERRLPPAHAGGRGQLRAGNPAPSLQRGSVWLLAQTGQKQPKTQIVKYVAHLLHLRVIDESTYKAEWSCGSWRRAGCRWHLRCVPRRSGLQKAWYRVSRGSGVQTGGEACWPICSR